MVVDNIEVTLVIAHTLQLYLEYARIGTELIVTDTYHLQGGPPSCPFYILSFPSSFYFNYLFIYLFLFFVYVLGAIRL